MSNNLLKGKRGIIFGALDPNSIAWITAERVHEEGGTFVLTNAPIAMRMGSINELAKKTGAEIIAADATSLEDLENLVTKSMEILGGKIDFVLHSIGMSVNVRKGRPYTDQKYDWTHVNALIFSEQESALYISTRHLSRITKISYPNGDIIWNMGRNMPSGDVSIGNEIGFSFQHGLQILDNGNIVTFDNGNLSEVAKEIKTEATTRFILALSLSNSGTLLALIFPFGRICLKELFNTSWVFSGIAFLIISFRLINILTKILDKKLGLNRSRVPY
mgnify:CR=1 FL=1